MIYIQKPYNSFSHSNNHKSLIIIGLVNEYWNALIMIKFFFFFLIIKLSFSFWLFQLSQILGFLLQFGVTQNLIFFEKLINKIPNLTISLFKNSILFFL